MATINRMIREYTHPGAKASKIDLVSQLERSVMSCLLWENSFYEDGASIADRITHLVGKVPAYETARIAIQAKEDMHLRHVPLLLARELARTKDGKSQLKLVLPKLITRPDDITEFLALYWKDGKKPLAKQVKILLGEAFRNFSEYQLQKYNGGSKAVKLRDAIKMTRPKPIDDAQAALWGRLVKGELQTPDTWEVAISYTKDKKTEWERLLTDNKLGGLAMLRNIRNMREAGINDDLIRKGISAINAGKLLPINFISAARYNLQFENTIEEKFFDCFSKSSKLTGKTILVVDVSGSMRGKLSAKSDLTRMDIAGAISMIAREMCEYPVIYCTAGNDFSRQHATIQIPARRGFSLCDYVRGGEANKYIGGGGIFLAQCIEFIKKEQSSADRIIVLTDEQDCDIKLNPASADAFGKYNYLINISSEKNGIGYHKWLHIDGWSDKVLDYIVKYESSRND